MGSEAEILAQARALQVAHESALAAYRQAIEEYCAASIAYGAAPGDHNGVALASAGRVLGERRQALDSALMERIAGVVALEQLAVLASSDLADRVAALERGMPGKYEKWQIP